MRAAVTGKRINEKNIYRLQKRSEAYLYNFSRIKLMNIISLEKMNLKNIAPQGRVQ